MNEKIDKVTEEVLLEGEKINRFVKSEEWAIIKGKLMEKINILDSLSTLVTDKKTKEQLNDEVMGRAGAVSILKEWLNDIEGIAESYKQNKELILDKEEGHIKILE